MHRPSYRALTALAVALSAVVLPGCDGDDDDDDDISFVRGTLEPQAGAPDTSLEATDDEGSRTTFDVAGSGDFELALRKGVYDVYVRTGASQLPLVMRVVGDRYETTLGVDHGGAAIDLGFVRVLSGQRATVSGGEPSNIIACVEGDIAGVPCPTGDAVVTCEGEGHGPDDEEHDGKHISDDQPDWTSAIVDPTVARWVPERAAPMELGCGGGDHDDDEEEEDDDD